MINALMQQQQAGKQDWARVGAGLSGLGQSASRLAGTDKITKFKEAGQKLFELGGLSEKNLKIVIKMYDLGPEETRELIVTCQTMSTFLKQKKMDQPLPQHVIEKIKKDTGTPIPDNATMEDVVKIVGAFPKQQEPRAGEPMVGPGGEISYTSKRPGTVLEKGQTPLSILQHLQKEKEFKATEKGHIAKAEKGEKKEESEERKAIKASLEKAIGNYEKAVLGIGQYIKDPNSVKIVKQEQARIQVLAQQYGALGGAIEDLGLDSLAVLQKWFAGEEPEKPQEQEGLSWWQKLTGSGSEKPAPVATPATPATPATERTATNPTTGEKLVWRNGKWIPLN